MKNKYNNFDDLYNRNYKDDYVVATSYKKLHI